MKISQKETKQGKRYVAQLDGCRNIAVIDADYGRCKSITIEDGVDCLLAPRNPFTMRTCLLVGYENGKIEEATTMPKIALTLGQVHCYTEDGEPGFLCNKQVVAAIGRAIADLNPFLRGQISVPSEEEADGILKELKIPYPPLAFVEAEKERPDIEIEWLNAWKKSGKLCYMGDMGVYEIESAVSADRKGNVEKSGDAVLLEMLGE